MGWGGVNLLSMTGPTPRQKLDHMVQRLAEAERDYAAGVPYPDHAGGSWPDKIAEIKKHIAVEREILANE